MGVRDGISDLYAWVRWEAGKLSGKASDAAIAVRVRRGGAVIELDRKNKAEAVPVEDPARAGEILKSLLPRFRLKPDVVVVVEADRVLKRRLAAMRLPMSRFRAMARLDVQSATPLDPADFHVIVPQYDEAARESSYYVVRKALLTPVVDSLRKAGLTIAAIRVADDGRIAMADPRSSRQVVPPSMGRRAFERLIAVGAVAAVVGFAAVIGIGHWRYSVAAATLEQSIAAAESEVKTMRALVAARNSRIEQIAAVRQAKQISVPLVSVIEEMSRRIPGHTWLSEIDVKRNSVRFTGFSPSAASLIPVLEASPLFSAPTFLEPVVKVSKQEGERFTIGMTIEAPNG